MSIRLVDAAWGKELAEALRVDASELTIVCPFIKVKAVDRLLSGHPKSIRVITRFNLGDFSAGVSDISALRRLLEAGAKIRGIRNLHAKLYLFGSSRAIVTSANLTESGISRNHEFGIVTDEITIIDACRSYFKELWPRGGSDLTLDQVVEWDEVVTRHRVAGGRSRDSVGLGDFGADAGITRPPPAQLPVIVADARQAFVKFLGQSGERESLSHLIIDEVRRSGCHRVLCYPRSKRPTSVQDDAVLFISRLTEAPNDIQVFGRAIAIRHVRERDEASIEDVTRRPFMGKWSSLLRIHHAEFVAGSMRNGVSLNEMMDALGPKAFSPTLRNLEKGSGNTNPRLAYMQQAAVELAPDGLAWLNERLQAVFDQHGRLPQDTLDELDWPASPVVQR